MTCPPSVRLACRKLGCRAQDLAREFMRGLIAAGDRAQARLVFECCRDAIAWALDTPPSAATLALAANLRQPGA